MTLKRSTKFNVKVNTSKATTSTQAVVENIDQVTSVDTTADMLYAESLQPSTSSNNNGTKKKNLTNMEINDGHLVPVQNIPKPVEPAPTINVIKPYSIITHRRRFVEKYGVEETVYKVKFTEEWEGRTMLDLLGDIYIMFEDLLNKVKSMYDDHVRCRVYIRHADLEEDGPLFIALRPINTMSAEAIMQALVKVLNSNQSLKIDKSLIIHIGVMDLPRGAGFKKLTRRNAGDVFNEKFEKRSILIIPKNNKHPTCAARAVVVATARLRKDPYYNNIRDPKRFEQYDIAFELLDAVHLPTDKPIEIRDFHLFEEYLGVQIIIYNRPFSQGCIYTGSKERSEK